jgi:hypothetical protein
MPIGLSVASFFNGLIWTAYGGIKGDKFILVSIIMNSNFFFRLCAEPSVSLK